MSYKHPYSKRRDKIFCTITYTDLEVMFNTKRRTIQRWIQKGILDPTNILDIIEVYNDKSLLNSRRKELRKEQEGIG